MKFVAIVAALATGCAAAPPAIHPTRSSLVVRPTPPPPKALKLAVLPVERLTLPRVAAAMNERLAKAAADGDGEATTAPISMEMALLQVECAQPSDECYGRIGRRLDVDRLLWGEIEQGSRARKRKDPPTTVRIVLYDVERAVVLGRAEETFSGDVPGEALDDMLSRATSVIRSGRR